MALVNCKECGGQVADSAPTCPKCGVVNPGKTTGELIITRKSQYQASLVAVQIFVDDRAVGEVRSGRTFMLELPVGEHSLTVKMQWKKKEAKFTIEEGKAMRYLISFSTWTNAIILEPE